MVLQHNLNCAQKSRTETEFVRYPNANTILKSQLRAVQ